MANTTSTPRNPTYPHVTRKITSVSGGQAEELRLVRVDTDNLGVYQRANDRHNSLLKFRLVGPDELEEVQL